MPYYQNVGLSTVSYFGVSIEPGQIEKLPQDVMNKDLVKVFFYPQDKVESSDDVKDKEPVKSVRKVRRAVSEHKQHTVTPDVKEVDTVSSTNTTESTSNDTKSTETEED